MDKKTPEVGEVWLLGHLPGGPPNGGSYSESRAVRTQFNKYSDMDGMECKIIEAQKDSVFLVHINSDPELWIRVSRRYLTSRVQPLVTSRVGSSVPCCENYKCPRCQSEMAREMAAKGMWKNPMTKMWEKRH